MVRGILAVLTGFVLSTGTAMAQTCSVPNSFTSGTAISAAQMNANFTALLACINTAPSGGGLPAAQGRLTLVSGAPVMTSAQTGQTTIYYTPYVGDQIVITTNGTSFSSVSFTELSNVTTNSGTGNAGPAAVVANSNYDLFVWSNSGSLVLTRGPAWTNDTTRSSGLQRIAGIWTNQSAITNGPGANLGTYVGTIRSDGSSQYNWQPGAVASGGTAAILGVWNAYNRVLVKGQVGDSTDSWAYPTATLRPADNSSGMRVSCVQGLQLDVFEARYSAIYADASYGAVAALGFDSTSAKSGQSALLGNNASGLTGTASAASNSLGFHFYQALEYGTGGTGTWYGDAGNAAIYQSGLFYAGMF